MRLNGKKGLIILITLPCEKKTGKKRSREGIMLQGVYIESNNFKI